MSEHLTDNELAVYLQGEDVSLSADLRAHLADCSECQAAVAFERRMLEAFSRPASLPEEALTSDPGFLRLVRRLEDDVGAGDPVRNEIWHPSAMVLCEYAEGIASPDDEVIRAHVIGCVQCQSLVAFDQRMRSAFSSPPPIGEAELADDAAFQRLRGTLEVSSGNAAHVTGQTTAASPFRVVRGHRSSLQRFGLTVTGLLAASVTAFALSRLSESDFWPARAKPAGPSRGPASSGAPVPIAENPAEQPKARAVARPRKMPDVAGSALVGFERLAQLDTLKYVAELARSAVDSQLRNLGTAALPESTALHSARVDSLTRVRERLQLDIERFQRLAQEERDANVSRMRASLPPTSVSPMRVDSIEAAPRPGKSAREADVPTPAGISKEKRLAAEMRELGIALLLPIEFDSSGPPRLTSRARVLLDAKIAAMRRLPSVRLAVIGHADEGKTVESNLSLAFSRAQIVWSYFISAGIVSARMADPSMGAERPRCLKDGAARLQRLRGVEFEIVAGGDPSWSSKEALLKAIGFADCAK